MALTAIDLLARIETTLLRSCSAFDALAVQATCCRLFWVAHIFLAAGNATNDEDIPTSHYGTSGKNSSKLSSRPGIHEAIAAIDSLFSKYTRSHLPHDAYSILVAFLPSIPAGRVSSSATLHRSDYSDNVSSAFLLIHDIVC